MKTYNIFISHAWAYGDAYSRMISMLNRSPEFAYRNYSAPEDNPLKNLDGGNVKNKSQIKDAIDRKISPASCVLVLSGMYAAHSEWMGYEISTSIRMRKPIIGIVPWGNERIPEIVANSANEIVRWNTESIVDAIKKYS